MKFILTVNIWKTGHPFLIKSFFFFRAPVLPFKQCYCLTVSWKILLSNTGKKGELKRIEILQTQCHWERTPLVRVTKPSLLPNLKKTKKIEVGAFLWCMQTACSLIFWIPAHFSWSLWHLADLLWFLYILFLPPGEGCTCCFILPCQLQQGDNDTDSIPALSRLILIRQMGKRWERLDCNFEKCDLGRQNLFFLHV